jgi:hypothetical protein
VPAAGGLSALLAMVANVTESTVPVGRMSEVE